MTQKFLQRQTTFDGLGIAPRLLLILDGLKFTVPTPIQHKSIPVAIEGKDIIGIAQTGTGKTLAFGVPMIQRLAQQKGMGLVLLPTRELAEQVNHELQKIGRSIGLRTALLIGGASMGAQRQMIRQRPHIIISTPGRLIDFLQQRVVSLQTVHILVLDEADRMLDIGFAPQIKEILRTLPRDRQTMLFSATMPHQIVELATQYMKLPLRIEVAPSGTAPEKVEQELIVVHKIEKMRLLAKLLQEYRGSVLVFSRTKYGAKRITHEVRNLGHRAAEIHSNRSLGQRRDALEGFKTGKYRILIATDIAARGIDVQGIELVINFDLPDNSDDYIHRIGRTGRAGHAGRAISFATPEQRGDVRAIERLLRMPLPTRKVEGFSDIRFGAPQVRSFGPRRFRRGSRYRRR
ncbi:MAG: DEAD/DEAH box helicase [Candidatus Doudnabacteria bacterium]|nr:DEAD/DEAH box helicase [Candidatus Doudnabacteria bacterium]